MTEVNNKFEIGEECYTYAREKKLEFDCPVCKGTKKIMFNDYWIPCKQCNKDGKIISDQTVVTPHKVRVRRIIASIWEDTVTVKYKVDCLDHEVNIRNCAEEGLYKTLEECEEKCREMNIGESKGVF